MLTIFWRIYLASATVLYFGEEDQPTTVMITILGVLRASKL